MQSRRPGCTEQASMQEVCRPRVDIDRNAEVAKAPRSGSGRCGGVVHMMAGWIGRLLSRRSEARMWRYRWGIQLRVNLCSPARSREMQQGKHAGVKRGRGSPRLLKPEVCN